VVHLYVKFTLLDCSVADNENVARLSLFDVLSQVNRRSLLQWWL